jgi:hypothetical protein
MSAICFVVRLQLLLALFLLPVLGLLSIIEQAIGLDKSSCLLDSKEALLKTSTLLHLNCARSASCESCLSRA